MLLLLKLIQTLRIHRPRLGLLIRRQLGNQVRVRVEHVAVLRLAHHLADDGKAHNRPGGLIMARWLRWGGTGMGLHVRRLASLASVNLSGNPLEFPVSFGSDFRFVGGRNGPPKRLVRLGPAPSLRFCL